MLSPINHSHRPQHQYHDRIFMVRRLSLYLTESLIYYELLKPGDSITGDRYWLQLISLSRALREKTGAKT